MSREMKESGIEWIQEIPKKWDCSRLKDYYNFEKGKKAALYTQEYIGSNQGDFPLYSGQTENNGVMGLINSYDYDIKECLFTTTVGAKVMTPKILKGKFSLSQNCLIMNQIKECDNRFIFYVLNPLFNYEKSLIPTYMQPSLRMSDLNKYQFYLPSTQEQQKIADYIDKKVSKIDNIINQTTLSIEAYKKYKYSVMAKCITKGIDTSVAMKSTNVDWLGEVPESWEYKKLKYIFSIKKDIAGKEGFDILSVTQSGLKIKDISKNEGQISADYSKYQIVDKGDFVMNHMDLLTGWVDYSEYYGVTSPDYRVFRFQTPEEYSSQYYKYIMQICYKNKIFYGLGQGVSNLGRWRLQTDKFLDFILPVPAKGEQQQIADYLDKKCSDIDSLITQKQQLLTEIEAYKRSLIYECVTGKREVY